MNTQSKKLNAMINEVEDCNTYFTNHVGSHDNDYIRKTFIILVVIATIGILFI